VTDTTNLLTAPQAAARLGMHRHSIDRVIRSGRLHAIRIGREYLLDVEDVEAFARTYSGRTGRPAGRKDGYQRTRRWGKAPAE
jgi:excisionase family DNA binding protein